MNLCRSGGWGSSVKERGYVKVGLLHVGDMGGAYGGNMGEDRPTGKMDNGLGA